MKLWVLRVGYAGAAEPVEFPVLEDSIDAVREAVKAGGSAGWNVGEAQIHAHFDSALFWMLTPHEPPKEVSDFQKQLEAFRRAMNAGVR